MTTKETGRRDSYCPIAELELDSSDRSFSARKRGSGIVPEHLRLAALIPKTLGFNRDIGLEIHGEAGAIREIDLKVGAIAPILKDGAQADDLSFEFFAFNHRV